MHLITPSCPHHAPTRYTELVQDATDKIIDILKRQEGHDGACSLMMEDVLDQLLVYHLKMMAEQHSREAAELFLNRVLIKLKYHGENVVARY